MEPDRRDQGRGVVVRDGFRPFGRATSALTLTVPARPEALGIVRLFVMSCGAAAGVELEEIFSRSQQVAEEFANILVAHPEAKSIVVCTQTGTGHVDLISVRDREVRHGP